MANGLYAGFKQALGLAGVNLTTDTIKVVLIDTGAYTVNLATHANLSDIPAAARLATATLAAKTWAASVFDADDTTFTAVPVGSSTAAIAEAVAIYKDTGTATTSTLIAYFDTATGLPVTPNGGDIQIVWDSGTNKIFKL